MEYYDEDFLVPGEFNHLLYLESENFMEGLTENWSLE